MTLFRITKTAQVSGRDPEHHFTRHRGPRWVLRWASMCTADVMAGLLGASFDFSLHGGLCFSTPLPHMPDNLRPDVRHSTSYLVGCSVPILPSFGDTVKLHGNCDPFGPPFLSFVRQDQSCLHLGRSFPVQRQDPPECLC